jgi:hypothetical protein
LLLAAGALAFLERVQVAQAAQALMWAVVVVRAALKAQAVELQIM